ncbi:low molecular weight protein-tyrosine-phosphatase [Paraburkholderia sp. RL17-337-BIB-A]|uniref:low molecular weight protein-tyrosine-phosphatase n=1 Tax=Paraburkholderia sp. RL17-337-BIB-A TaxID=3031636 RepID=UPI0038B94995
MIRSILTICIGNICRSPMAEALLASELPNCVVQSAGVAALVGQQADPFARELMRAEGLDIERHRAKQLMRSHCMSADLLLVMDLKQKRYVERFSPWSRGRVFRLGQFDNLDIRDPFGRGRAEFINARDSIEKGVRAWATKIEASDSWKKESEMRMPLCHE